MENENAVSDHQTVIPVNEVLASLDTSDKNAMLDALGAMHPSYVATILESLPATKRIDVVSSMTEEQMSLVLPQLHDAVRRQVVGEIPTPQLSVVANMLNPSDLAVAIDELSVSVSDEVLATLDFDNRARLNAILDYPVGTAARLMTTDALSVRPTTKIEAVLRWLRRRETLPPYTSALMVTDDAGKYLGKLLMSAVVTANPEASVASVMEPSSEFVRAAASESEVAQLFDQRHLVTAAVLDDEDHLLGRVTVDHAMEILRREADHALLSQAGLKDEADLFAPILPSAKQRGVWLGINLATVFLAAWVIGQFQHALDQLVALAVLMPIVASMGGIAGSQTLTLTIRGLALNQVVKGNIRWLATKELGVGALNGVVWSVVVALITYLWFKNAALSLIIAAAMLLNLLAAALSGVAVPLALKRLGMDPALAGAVVLTTVTDIVGFLSFLGLATLYLI